MRKGFTLVEMLAVVLILGIILLIGVPIYQGVQKSTNESIYNSKISNVLTKAEEYSEEHGIFIYDIRKMISLGLLTPDNEAGEFRDPRDNRSMLCDVIQVTLENGMYYANVSTGYNDDGSVHCYSDDELKSMNSIVKINFYKERDGLEQFPSGWVKANHVYAGYEFIGSPEVSNVNVTWGGVGTQLDNGRLDIYTDSLMNAEVQLHIEFDYNGKHIIQDISKNVRIDNESPRGYVTTGPGTEKSNNLSYVEWQLTDGDGSGVAGHIILDEESYRIKPCESYTVDEIPGSDQTRVGKHLNNGVYYICAKDNVGNITRNSDAEENRIEVKNVDQSSGDIESFKIESRTPPYNLKEVKLITELKDETPSGYDMCMSHTGYLENCSWEEFNSSKDYTINGYDYGSEVAFYLSVRDSAGNVSNIASTYTIDNLQYLDLNGKLNGEDKPGLSGFGKCDVYVNEAKVATETNDYYQKLVPGSTYEIKNCSALSGFRYKGASNMTGVIGRSGASVVYVPYVSLYTISYNVNGGMGSVGSQIKEHGTNINVTTAKPTRNGYTFDGWNTKADATGANYAAGATYSGNGNATLYAKWKLNSYIVTLDANGGTVNDKAKDTKEVSIGSNVGTLPIAKRNNYQFLGWYNSNNISSSSLARITSSTKPSSSVTYYALWKGSGEVSSYSYTLYTNCSDHCMPSGIQSLNNHGTIYLANGDKVNIKCYNERHSGTGFHDALAKNRVPLQWYGATVGASTSTSFTYNGTQNGTWSCDKYYYEHAGNTWDSQDTYYKQNYASIQAAAEAPGNMGSDGSNCYGQCDRVTFQSGNFYIEKWVDNTTTTVNVRVGGNPIVFPTHQSLDASQYYFNGWYTGPNGTGTRLSSGMRTPQSDVTYYAHWIKLTGQTRNYKLQMKSISNLGTVYAKLGDRVKIYCYNDKHLGTGRKVYLQYNNKDFRGPGDSREGSTVEYEFVYDGSQKGFYSCYQITDGGGDESSKVYGGSTMTLQTG